MKKILAALIALLILGTSTFIIQNPNLPNLDMTIQENMILDNTLTTDDSSEKKDGLHSLSFFTMAVIFSICIFNRSGEINRRLFFLTTVFYQSNFVISSPLNEVISNDNSKEEYKMMWFRLAMIGMFSMTALSLLFYQGTEIYQAFLEFFNKNNG